MILAKPNIKYINTVTHEGKVLIVASVVTANGTQLYYTIKQDGFEDSALQNPNDVGWEGFKALALPDDSVGDPSVAEQESQNFTDTSGNYLIRSVYKSADLTAAAPVQLVSHNGYVYLFRQSTRGTLLVDRFVLDGMTNSLNPTLEVRYRRSRQRYKPIKAMKINSGGQMEAIDALDFRDMQNQPFYEPTTEIGPKLLNGLLDGWFGVVVNPTHEVEGYRWHFFIYNAQSQRVDTLTLHSGDEQIFTLRDYTLVSIDDLTNAVTYIRVPGIIQQKITLQDSQGQALLVNNGLAAVKYDVQYEDQTATGPQLLRDASKIMLAVPTDAGIATLSFAIADDGTLAQITPNVQNTLLRSRQSEVLLPLTVLDNLRAVGDTQPAPSGTIVGMSQSTDDSAAERVRVQVADADQAALAKLSRGDVVKLANTTSYNGLYQVASVTDGNAFTINAPFTNGEVGEWEKVETEDIGLIFDGMITGYQKVGTGLLQVNALNHGLQSGDWVQVVDSPDLAGEYPILAQDANSFTVQRLWVNGDAVNLKLESRKRRGLVFDGKNDWIEVPLNAPLTLTVGFALEAWVKLNNAQNQTILATVPDAPYTQGGVSRGWQATLGVNNGKFSFAFVPLNLPGISPQRLDSPTPATLNQWVHVACALDDKVLRLLENGVVVATLPVATLDQAAQAAYTAWLTQVRAEVKQQEATAALHALDAQHPANYDRGQLVLRTSGKVLSGELGATLVLAAANEQTEQQWRIEGVRPAGAQGVTTTFAIYNLATQLVLDNRGQQGAWQNLDSQLWLLDSTNDGYFQLRCKQNNLMLTEQDGQLILRAALPADSPAFGQQQWWFEALGEGKVNLIRTIQKLLEANQPRAGTAISFNTSTLTLAGQISTAEVGKAVKAPQLLLQGQLAEVRLWNNGRTDQDILNNMHLRLTGREAGLVGDWPLGGVSVDEEDKHQVFDFSVAANQGIVHGAPYGGGVTLGRTLRDNVTLATKYSNDELFAVRTVTYVESFEFRTDTSVDPQNADGKGNAIFKPSIWGQMSRSAETRQPVPAFQPDFQFEALADGWYRATCRFLPQGVRLVRCFEISDVKGNWRTLEIRRHHTQYISSVVTLSQIESTAQVPSLVNPLIALADPMLALLNDKDAVQRRLTELTQNADRLKGLIATNDAAYQTLATNPLAYWLNIGMKFSAPQYMYLGAPNASDVGNMELHDLAPAENGLWQVIALGNGEFRLQCKANGKVLCLFTDPTQPTVAKLIAYPLDYNAFPPDFLAARARWQLEPVSSGRYRLKNVLAQQYIYPLTPFSNANYACRLTPSADTPGTIWELEKADPSSTADPLAYWLRIGTKFSVLKYMYLGVPYQLDSTNMELHDQFPAENGLWQVIALGNGEFRLQCKANGRVLCLFTDPTQPTVAKLIAYPLDYNAFPPDVLASRSRWQLEPVASGRFRLKNVLAQQYIYPPTLFSNADYACRLTPNADTPGTIWELEKTDQGLADIQALQRQLLLLRYELQLTQSEIDLLNAKGPSLKNPSLGLVDPIATLRQIERSEQEEAALVTRQKELEALLAAAKGTDTVQQHMNEVLQNVNRLKGLIAENEAAYQTLAANPLAYWLNIGTKLSAPQYMFMGAPYQLNYPEVELHNLSPAQNGLWQVISLGNGEFRLQCKANSAVLCLFPDPTQPTVAKVIAYPLDHSSFAPGLLASYSRWQLEPVASGRYRLKNVLAQQYIYPIVPYSNANYACRLTASADMSGTVWEFEKTDQGLDELQALQRKLTELSYELKLAQNELDALNAALNASNNQINQWEQEVSSIKNALSLVRQRISQLTTGYLNLVVSLNTTAQQMPDLPGQADPQGLKVQAALLPFVRAASRLHALESCTGQLALTYQDQWGQLHQTRYDTAYDADGKGEEWLPDTYRVALVLRGNSPALTLPERIFGTVSKQITIEFWAKGGSDLPQALTFMGATDQQNNPCLRIQLPNEKEEVVWEAGAKTDTDAVDRLSHPAEPRLYRERWTHWAFVKDSDKGEMKIYVNGRLWYANNPKDKEGVMLKQPIPTIKRAALGGLPGDSSTWHGQLAELRIWNVALAERELEANSLLSLKGNEPGLVVYYPLREAQGDLARDVTGQGRHLQVTGNSWAAASMPIGRLYTYLDLVEKPTQVGGPNSFTQLPRLNLDFSEGVTLETLVRFDTLNQPSRIFALSDGPADPYQSILLSSEPETKLLNFVVHNNGQSYTLQTANPLPVGEWVYIAATIQKNGLATLYVNGSAIANRQMALPVTTPHTGNYVGKSTWSWNAAFQGQINFARVYENTLKATEIGSNAQQHATGQELLNAATLFDGKTKFVQLPALNKDFSHGFTIEAQVRFDEFQWQSRIIELGNGPDNQANIMFGNEKTTNNLSLAISNNGQLQQITAQNALPKGEWVYVAATIQADGTAKLYINGVEKASGQLALPIMVTRNQCYVGKSNWANDALFKGQINFVRLWNQPLSPLDILRTGQKQRLVPLLNTPTPFDGAATFVQVPPMNLDLSAGLTIEAHVRFDAFNSWSRIIDLANGPNNQNILLANERTTNTLSFTIYKNGTGYALRAPNALPLGEWVYVAATIQIDGLAKLYVNGVEKASGQMALPVTVLRNLCYVGKSNWANDALFKGQMDFVRLWRTVLSPTEIGRNAQIYNPRPLNTPALFIGTEYSRVMVDAQQRKDAMMMRTLAWATDEGVRLLDQQRIEALDLKWIGNAQIKPTLIGYMEGAPPVPSENLTEEDKYNGAASVELVRSSDVNYSWTREENVGLGAAIEAFGGEKSKTLVGGGFLAEIFTTAEETELKLGGTFDFSYHFQHASTVGASHSLSQRDRLELRGNQELEANFPVLGKRFIPKNVGYALVTSGLADIFVSKLRRTGRMVGYQVLPVDGVPLDVNTITFLINPAYTMSGSLDGMTGTQATSQRFFRQVPDMRAQYGSLYPASYLRLAEAYRLKADIERQDQRHQAYFNQFYEYAVDEATLARQIGSDDDTPVSVNTPGVDSGASTSALGEIDKKITAKEDELATLQKATPVDQAAVDRCKAELYDLQAERLRLLQQQQEDERNAGSARQRQIESSYSDLSTRAHATASFAGWQRNMENLQVRAGKRNIVNTYVWDGDGGLHVEEQQFASTVEHSIGGSFDMDLGIGSQMSLAFAKGLFEAKFMFHATLTQTMSKKEADSSGMELHVDLSGVESRGITDYNDYPLLPGEKVDRYRFMSFFLENNTDHWHDFFDEVVDPEWLNSNDEEARALRETRNGRPNKVWRVLHRVTYVERPSLMGFGRQIPNITSTVTTLQQLRAQVKELTGRLGLLQDEVSAKLDQILSKLPK